MIPADGRPNDSKDAKDNKVLYEKATNNWNTFMTDLNIVMTDSRVSMEYLSMNNANDSNLSKQPLSMFLTKDVKGW